MQVVALTGLEPASRADTGTQGRSVFQFRHSAL